MPRHCGTPVGLVEQHPWESLAIAGAAAAIAVGVVLTAPVSVPALLAAAQVTATNAAVSFATSQGISLATGIATDAAYSLNPQLGQAVEFVDKGVKIWNALTSLDQGVASLAQLDFGNLASLANVGTLNMVSSVAGNATSLLHMANVPVPGLVDDASTYLGYASMAGSTLGDFGNSYQTANNALIAATAAPVLPAPTYSGNLGGGGGGGPAIEPSSFQISEDVRYVNPDGPRSDAGPSLGAVVNGKIDDALRPHPRIRGFINGVSDALTVGAIVTAPLGELGIPETLFGLSVATKAFIRGRFAEQALPDLIETTTNISTDVESLGKQSGGSHANFLEPDSNAIGPHTTFRSDPSGVINHYETWEINPFTGKFVSEQRFRGNGGPHNNVQPPLMHVRRAGKGPGSPTNQARPASPDEIPSRNRNQ